MLRAIKIVTGLLATNTFIVFDDKKLEGIIIDPGGDEEIILNEIGKHGLKVTFIVATHLHIDHVAGVNKLLEVLKAKFMYHRLEEPFRENKAMIHFARFLGYNNVNIPKADNYLEEGDEIAIGDERLKVLHTPGHSPGSISLYTEGHVFSGDVIFMDGVGRTDLPGGDWDSLLGTIRDKIFTLGDDTVIHPGHGPETTVGREKRENIFLT